MKPDYSDVVDAAGEPLWWDAYGCPRYAPFAPGMLGVYDHFALLVLIECQSCTQPFLVGEGWTRTDWRMDFSAGTEVLAEQGWVPCRSVTHTLEGLAEGYHYGDPPNHACGGSSSNCVDIRIEQAWERAELRWERRPEIERIDIFPSWADPVRHRAGRAG